jgi:hypothetical protein
MLPRVKLALTVMTIVYFKYPPANIITLVKRGMVSEKTGFGRVEYLPLPLLSLVLMLIAPVSQECMWTMFFDPLAELALTHIV